MRIAINGFGRIGKTFLRVLLADKQAQEKIDLVAINCGPSAIHNIVQYITYDTVMGKYDGFLSMQGSTLLIDKQKIEILNKKDPDDCSWKKYAVDWIVESSGCFTHRSDAEKHLKSGARGVLITAPAYDEDVSIIPGINDDAFNKNKHHIVSLGSCTSNALLPLLKVLYESCGFLTGFMTTIHAYTNSQVVLDNNGSDLTRSRAAGLNIIPTQTGACKMIEKVMPFLRGKVETSAIRVPVAKVSLIDLFFQAQKTIAVDELCMIFKKASESNLKKIIGFSEESLVSADFSGSPYSVIFDATMIKTIGPFGHIFGWYDNEWAYCQRLKDFLLNAE